MSPRHVTSGKITIEEVLQAIDWGKTPLGRADRWSQSLMKAAELVLASPTATSLAWGRELNQLFNDPFRRLFGDGLALGQRAADTFRASWAQVGPLFEHALAGRAIADDDLVLSLPEPRRFAGSATPVRDEHGAVGGVLLALLETKPGRSDEILGRLGHELRNPLAAIAAAVALIRRQASAAFPQEFAIIERQVKALESLVDHAQDMSRLARGTLTVRLSLSPLTEVVEWARQMAVGLLEEHRQQLAVEVSEALMVECDPRHLAKVFFHLIANAAKHTPPGGHIAVRAVEKDEDVLIAIEDDGPGIPAALLPRIFDGSSQQGASGLGVGLALVKTLVQLHGGTVELASVPQQGTRVTVRLPRAAPLIDTSVSLEEERTNPRIDPRFRVLIVDDNVDGADIMAMALRGRGYAVKASYDGREALEVAETFRPQVALLDVGLPDMSGYELGAKLRQLVAPQPVLLVALTGLNDEAGQHLAREAGFALHLTKPVAIETVDHALRELRAGRR